MTKQSFIVAVFMVFLVCSSHLESVAGQVSPAECEDSCSMGCINVDRKLPFYPSSPQICAFSFVFFYMNIVCVERLAARCERKCRIKCYPAGDLLKSFSKFYNLYRKKKLFLKINLNFSIFFYSNYYYYYEVTFWCDTCL